MPHDIAEFSPAGEETGLLQSLWHYKWSSLVIVLLCAGLGLGASLLLAPEGQATARFAVADPRGNSLFRQGVTTDASFTAYTAQRAAYTESDVVLGRARDILARDEGLEYTLTGMRSMVDSGTDGENAIVVVSATSPTQEEAAKVANAVVQAYSEVSLQDLQEQQERTERAITTAREQVLAGLGQATDDRTRQAIDQASAQALAQLAIRGSDAAVDVSQFGPGTRFVDRADPNAPATSSQVARNTVIGGGLGLLLAAVVAFLRADREARRGRHVQTAPQGEATFIERRPEPVGRL